MISLTRSLVYVVRLSAYLGYVFLIEGPPGERRKSKTSGVMLSLQIMNVPVNDQSRRENSKVTIAQQEGAVN